MEVSELSSLALPLASTDAGSGKRRYKAYPSLRKARWLFPAGEPAMRRAGIRELFRPSSLKGRVLKGLILSGGLRGEGVELEAKALSNLESEASRALNEPSARCVFYVGTPGAYRKATALILKPTGETLAFAKIAATPLARADVETEHRNLLRLSGGVSLNGQVPKPLRLFDWQGARLLLITGGPSRPGPRQLSAEHVEFCAKLADLSATSGTFDASPMSGRLAERIAIVAPELPDASDLLQRAFERLRRELDPATLRFYLAHRDFAPWNTRLGPRGLFVFDWDHAEEGATPLYDLFHFQAIQAALFGRRSPVPDPRILQEAAAKICPEAREHLSPLYLAYLLDMALLYGEARVVAPEAGESGVWNWFKRSIEDFLSEGAPL